MKFDDYTLGKAAVSRVTAKVERALYALIGSIIRRFNSPEPLFAKVSACGPKTPFKGLIVCDENGDSKAVVWTNEEAGKRTLNYDLKSQRNCPVEPEKEIFDVQDLKTPVGVSTQIRPKNADKRTSFVRVRHSNEEKS